MAVEAPTSAPAEDTAPVSEESTEPTTEAPPWGEDFDPERAWKTIQHLRDVERAYKAEKAEQERTAKEKADAEKSEVQRLADQLAEAQEALRAKEREALVARLAREHSLPDDVLDLLTGDNEEQLTAKAERLAGLVQPKTPESAPPGKPRPRLTPGDSPAGDVEDDFDPQELAAQIRRDNR